MANSNPISFSENGKIHEIAQIGDKIRINFEKPNYLENFWDQLEECVLTNNLVIKRSDRSLDITKPEYSDLIKDMIENFAQGLRIDYQQNTAINTLMTSGQSQFTVDEISKFKIEGYKVQANGCIYRDEKDGSNMTVLLPGNLVEDFIKILNEDDSLLEFINPRRTSNIFMRFNRNTYYNILNKLKQTREIFVYKRYF